MKPRAAKADTPTTATPANLAIFETVSDVLSMVLLGSVLIYSDRWFAFTSEEALTLDSAAQPFREIIHLFHAGVSLQDHALLYNLLLHVWLSVTGGALGLVRVPAILFFLAGVWILSRAARRISGASSGSAVLWIAVLWPYGFHFGRFSGIYGFSFLLVSALTFLLFQYRSAADPRTWALIFILAAALIYTTYLGWLVLFLLGYDDWLENRRNNRASALRLLGTAAALAIVYIPMWGWVAHDVSTRARLRQPWQLPAINTAYHAYLLLISESLAPWIWRFGVPAAIAVTACLVVAFAESYGRARRILVYGSLLLVILSTVGLLQTQTLLLVAPWFLLPVGVALATSKSRQLRGALSISLLLVAAFGWYGAFTRRYYATPHFFEPWENIAAQSTDALRNAAGVIGDDPAFFFQLTYATKAPQPSPSWSFVGLLPKTVRFPQVWAADDWVAAGQPVQPYMLWVHGTPTSPQDNQQMQQAADFLDHRCGDRSVRYLARDPAFVWKQRFFPSATQSPWLIEIHQYACAENAAAPAPPVQPTAPVGPKPR